MKNKLSVEYEKNILVKLIESYRKSKKDTGENKINRSTKIKPEKFIKNYRSNIIDDKIDIFNDAAQTLADMGFITCIYKKFSTEIIELILNDRKINEIEEYLSVNYGVVSKDNKLKKLVSIIEKYYGKSKICSSECERLKSIVESRKLTKTVEKDIEHMEDILDAVMFVENNDRMLYLREASMLIYGKSKYFEENTLDQVCSLLRKYSDKLIDDEKKYEILKDYNIWREPQKFSLKGDAVITIDGRNVDISCFANGIEFNEAELLRLEKITINSDRFMTVENRTSYLRAAADNCVVFYLGGYAGANQRDFLKMVYKSNTDKEYLHFGDIDAGGLLIHKNLCNDTGIHFSLYNMNTETLSDEKYRTCLQPLEHIDIIRLNNLRSDVKYRELVDYMLENNVKLEQEIIGVSNNLQ